MTLASSTYADVAKLGSRAGQSTPARNHMQFHQNWPVMVVRSPSVKLSTSSVVRGDTEDKAAIYGPQIASLHAGTTGPGVNVNLHGRRESSL